jgi:hypothetical protein
MPSATHAAAFPLVSIENVDGLTISGFLLDGDYRAQTILELKGRCSGLVLDDLRIEGFQRSGIVADNLACPAQQDARLENLWIRPRHPDNQAVQSALTMLGKSCEGLQLRHCRIQGPYQSALLFSAPTGRFMMEQCKLYQGSQALTFAESLPPKPRFATICQQNTFWDFDAAIAVQAPLAAEEIQLAFRNNLFYLINNVLRVDETRTKIKPENLASGFTGLGNVYDQAGSKPGQASRVGRFGLKALPFSLPTVLNSLDFLRYPSDSPLRTAGANQDPVGAVE